MTWVQCLAWKFLHTAGAAKKKLAGVILSLGVLVGCFSHCDVSDSCVKTQDGKRFMVFRHLGPWAAFCSAPSSGWLPGGLRREFCSGSWLPTSRGSSQGRVFSGCLWPWMLSGDQGWRKAASPALCPGMTVFASLWQVPPALCASRSRASGPGSMLCLLSAPRLEKKKSAPELCPLPAGLPAVLKSLACLIA